MYKKSMFQQCKCTFFLKMVKIGLITSRAIENTHKKKHQFGLYLIIVSQAQRIVRFTLFVFRLY